MPRKIKLPVLGRGGSALLLCFLATAVTAQDKNIINQAKSRNLKDQYALVVNPYNVNVEFLVESTAGTSVPIRVAPRDFGEFLCVKCVAILTTEQADGALAEVKQQLSEGKRYRVTWTNARYELREVLAR